MGDLNDKIGFGKTLLEYVMGIHGLGATLMTIRRGGNHIVLELRYHTKDRQAQRS